MGVQDAFLAGALIVLTLIVRFPEQYRRGMARLCSVEVDRFPPFPRVAAGALFIFFGAMLLFDLLHYVGWR
jgi:hypothetical protein